MSRGSILQHEHHFDQHLPISGEARTRRATPVPERLGIAHFTVALHRSKNALPVQDPVEVSG